jgi:hypothetical protein
MPILNDVPLYQPMQPYYFDIDNVPIIQLKNNIAIVNDQTDYNSSLLNDAAGQARDLNTRLNQSMDSHGNLLTAAVNAANHNIADHAEATTLNTVGSGSGATINYTGAGGNLTAVALGSTGAGGGGYQTNSVVYLNVNGGTGGIVSGLTNSSGVITSINAIIAPGTGYPTGSQTNITTTVSTNGDFYVIMKNSERANLNAILNGLTPINNLSVFTGTISNTTEVDFINTKVQFQPSAAFTWTVTDGNQIAAQFTYAGSLHQHNYEVTPTTSDGITYTVPGGIFLDGTLRVFVNGVRIFSTNSVPVPSYNLTSGVPTWRTINIAFENSSAGTFSVLVNGNPTTPLTNNDVIRVDFDNQLT